MAQPSGQDSADQATRGPSSAARKRQMILFTILILGVIALLWEFRVARPKSEQAYEAVQNMLKTNYAGAGEVTNTNEDVKKLIGKAPAQTIPRDQHAVEVYKWRRGLPIMAYTVQVLYNKKEDGRMLLVNAKLNEAFTDEDLNLTIILPAPEPLSEPSTETVNRDDDEEEASEEKGTEVVE